MLLKTSFVSCAGGAATLFLTPALVAAAGFTAVGITANSFAAWLMSTFASLSGGGVAAGGVVAMLQSIGKSNRFDYLFLIYVFFYKTV